MLDTINKQDQRTCIGIYVTSLITLGAYFFGSFFLLPMYEDNADKAIIIYFFTKISFVLFMFCSIVGSIFSIACQSSVSDQIKTLLHVNTALAFLLLLFF